MAWRVVEQFEFRGDFCLNSALEFGSQKEVLAYGEGTKIERAAEGKHYDFFCADELTDGEEIGSEVGSSD